MAHCKADSMKARFKRLSPTDQIHIAIERERKTARGAWSAGKRYSAERLKAHEEWVKSHYFLLSEFKLERG